MRSPEEIFSEIPEGINWMVDTLESYPSEANREEYVENVEKFCDYLERSDKAYFVGTGRQQEVAQFPTRYLKANGKKVGHSEDTSYPQKYEPEELVVAYSSSGETSRTLHFTRPAIKSSTPVIAITTNPDSSLGRIAEKTDGFVVQIPGKSKEEKEVEYPESEFIGSGSPLDFSGTSGELYSLKFTLDAVGNYHRDGLQDVLDYSEKLWEEVKDFEVGVDELLEAYKTISKPGENKRVVSGLGLSGVVGRLFATRLSHCAGLEEDGRNVHFYKECGMTAANPGDTFWTISGSGRQFWADNLRKLEEKDVDTVSVTSYPNSPLAEISDVVIEIPGRKDKNREDERIEHTPPDPMDSVFELRSILTHEEFLYSMTEAEEIPIPEVNDQHPEIT